MQLPIFEKYIDELIEKSTLDVPHGTLRRPERGKLPAGTTSTAA